MIDELKQRALHRAKILEGQMRGVQKMIDDEESFTAIVTQNLAIQKSISSLNKLLLENHIRTQVKHGLSSATPDVQEQTVEDLLALYELTNIRSR